MNAQEILDKLDADGFAPVWKEAEPGNFSIEADVISHPTGVIGWIEVTHPAWNDVHIEHGLVLDLGEVKAEVNGFDNDKHGTKVTPDRLAFSDFSCANVEEVHDMAYAMADAIQAEFQERKLRA